MALKIESTLQAINTATGSQTVSIAGFGPIEAVICVLTRAAGGDDHAAEAGMSIGFYDGTNNRSVGCAMRNGLVTPDADRLMSDLSCGVLALTSTIDTVIRGTSLAVDDDFTFNVQTNDTSTAWLCQFTFFGGTDIDRVWADHHDDLGTGSGSPVTITTDSGGTPFQADLVFMLGNASGTAITGDDIAANAALMFGVWSADDATQFYGSMAQESGGSGSNSTNHLNNSNITGQTVWVGPSDWFGAASTNANGFAITPSVSAGSDIVVYLAIKWATTPTIEIVESTLPASAVDWTESGFSAFTPGWGMTCMTSATVADTTLSGGEDMSLTVATYEDSQVLSSGISDDDGAGTTLNSSWAKSTFFIGDPNGTAALSEGTLQSIQSGGWTIDLGGAGSHDSIARKGWSLAIDTGGESVSDVNYSSANRGIMRGIARGVG